MGKVAASLAGALILAVLAAGLAEATLAMGQSGSLSNDTMIQISASPAASPRPAASPKATPTPRATPTLTATPVPSPSATPVPTATTNAFVHLRVQPSTSSEILANLNGGTEVQLLSGGNADWQEVEYQGLTGYIFTSYLSY